MELFNCLHCGKEMEFNVEVDSKYIDMKNERDSILKDFRLLEKSQNEVYEHQIKTLTAARDRALRTIRLLDLGETGILETADKAVINLKEKLVIAIEALHACLLHISEGDGFHPNGLEAQIRAAITRAAQ